MPTDKRRPADIAAPKYVNSLVSGRDGFNYTAVAHTTPKLTPVASTKKVVLVRPDTALTSRNVS